MTRHKQKGNILWICWSGFFFSMFWTTILKSGAMVKIHFGALVLALGSRPSVLSSFQKVLSFCCCSTMPTTTKENWWPTKSGTILSDLEQPKTEQKYFIAPNTEQKYFIAPKNPIHGSKKWKKIVPIFLWKRLEQV